MAKQPELHVSEGPAGQRSVTTYPAHNIRFDAYVGL
jgi:hypothetical protein